MKLLKNTSFMTLIGVMVGGLITGVFNYANQKSLIEFQDRQFKIDHFKRKNESLKKQIDFFVEDLSQILLNSKLQKNENSRDSIFSEMFSSAMKITLLEDYKIGNECLNLTSAIKETFDKGAQFRDTEKDSKLILNWAMAIKTEMKLADYSINDESFEKDMIGLLLKEQFSKK